MSMSWPTASTILSNNLKVAELVNRYNGTNNDSELRTIYEESLLLNPNDMSDGYANQLNSLKYNLYQKFENDNNDNNDNNNVIR